MPPSGLLDEPMFYNVSLCQSQVVVKEKFTEARH